MIYLDKASIIIFTHENTKSYEKLRKVIDLTLKQENTQIKKVWVIISNNSILEGENIIELESKNKIEDKRLTILKKEKNYTKGYIIKKILKNISTDFIIILDMEIGYIYLRKNCVCAYIMSLKREKNNGMVYGDYGIYQENNKIKEKFLLDYHNGRVRDDLDIGFVYGFRTSLLKEIEIDENIKYHTFYDIRLKISENYNIKHISNKLDGISYLIEKYNKKDENLDVFSYLKKSKDYQLEAEKVLTSHLKRIDAYLEPYVYYPYNLTSLSLVGNNTKEYKIPISIIIPVYKRPEFISLAIESAIAQTIKDKIEIIVIVNGGEKDKTADIVREYLPNGKKYKKDNPPIKLVVVDINNIGFCLNIGLSYAQGKYYLQLDSDDRLKEDAAEKVLKMFNEEENIGMVIGSYEVWEKKENGEIVRRKDIPVVTHDEWTEENGRNNLLRINGAGAPRAYLIKAIKEKGGFSLNDEAYSRNYGEDYEMVLKISESYKIKRIWQPIYEVIRHEGGTDHSITEDILKINNEAKDMMRLKAIKRRQYLVKKYKENLYF